MAAYDLSLAVDYQVGVEDGAQRLGDFFVDPHDDHGVGLAGAMAELFGCRAGNRYGVFDEFTKNTFSREKGCPVGSSTDSPR